MTDVLIFEVQFERPEGVTIYDARDYVEDAVRIRAGSLCLENVRGEYDPSDPPHPMSMLDADTVQVRIRKIVKEKS